MQKHFTKEVFLKTSIQTFSIKLVILLSFLLNSKILYSQQLQQANNLQIVNTISESNRAVLDAPKKIETINLKIDTTNIFLKGQQAKDNANAIELDAISYQVLNSNLKLKEAEEKIYHLQEIKKTQRTLTEEQQNRLEEYQAILKVQKDSINKLTESASELKKNLQSKTAEAAGQLAMKKQYRKEYYDKLLDEFRNNIQILDSNYRIYKRELSIKEDSLAPQKWPLYASNKDSMIRDMAAVYSQLLVNTKEMQNRLEDLIKDYPEIQKKVKAFEEIDVVLKFGAQTEEYVDKLFSERKKEAVDVFIAEKSHNDEFQKKYDEYRTDFQLKLSKVSDVWTKYKPDEQKQSSDASVLANFTQPLNQNTSLIPGIDVFAYKNSIQGIYLFMDKQSCF